LFEFILFSFSLFCLTLFAAVLTLKTSLPLLHRFLPFPAYLSSCISSPSIQIQIGIPWLFPLNHNTVTTISSTSKPNLQASHSKPKQPCFTAHSPCPSPQPFPVSYQDHQAPFQITTSPPPYQSPQITGSSFTNSHQAAHNCNHAFSNHQTGNPKSLSDCT
jgi:hypothetical protein